MITTIQQGTYQLLETKNQTKVLILDGTQTYAWVNIDEIGEILVAAHDEQDTDTLLSSGAYRIYDVKGEPQLTDIQHLELEVEKDKWQGYLLLTGLPNEKDKRNRIIPTDQLVLKA